MKRAIITAGGLIVLFVIFLSISELTGSEKEIKNTATSYPDPDEFLIGAYSAGCSPNNVMNQLGLNIWHRFLWTETGSNPMYHQTIFPRGYLDSDKLFNTVGQYQTDVVNYYNGASQLNNNYLYLTRPKIEMLSFAQRSDYNPCDIPIHGSTDKGQWWYAYNVHDVGTDIQDNGKWVRKCTVNQPAGYVVKDLRPTLEQSNNNVPNDFFNDAIYSWYVKPNVRIDPNVQGSTPIFRVEIYKKDGTWLKSVIITRDDFDFGSPYQNGQYKDIFFPLDNTNPLFIYDGQDLYGTNPDANNPKNDYAIWWYGNCDMWLEHVRVENDWASKLFNDYYVQTEQPWIQWEAQNIASASGVNSYKFLVDESEMNMYPAINYLNGKINSFRPQDSKLSLIALSNIVYSTPFQRALPNQTWMWNEPLPLDIIKSNFQSSGMNEIFVDLYPVYADKFWKKDNPNKHNYVPNTLECSDYDVSRGRLGDPAGPEIYEENFNANLEDDYHRYIKFMQNTNAVSRQFNVPIIAAVQIHSWFNKTETEYSLREPTNEEIEVLTGIPLTYGAKGIIYHAYNSIGMLGINNMFSRGLVGNEYEDINEENQCDDQYKRLINAYGQEKWNKITSLNAKLKILGSEIINFDNTQSRGYRLHNETDRTDIYQNSCFYHIAAFKYGSGTPNCTETYIPSGMTFDCPDESYLQVGTFKSKTNEPYFMLVNKRCSPVKEGFYDGRRMILVKTKQNFPDFAGHDNWNIVDVYDNSVRATFNKNQYNTSNLGWIMPGEIKLYKFVPVVIGGGTLQTDETISGNITCKGMIYGNGHNILINQGVTLSFADTAGIEMNGGVFVCGVNADNAPAVTLKGEGNNNIWNGLILNNCDSVGIYNTNITNIIANDTAKAVLLTNCYKSEFRKNTITANNNSGGIQAVFNNVSDDPIILKIRECNFYMNQSGYSAINVISNASVTLPLNIEWCIFNAGNDTSNAVMLSEVTGGVIKNNLFSNFGKSAVFMLSTVDLYGNVILGRNNSQGIQCLAGSSISLSPSSGMYLGGYNYFRNYGSTSSNIYSDNSMFYINNGQNDFDLDDLDNSVHFSGTLSGNIVSSINATKNCFHEDSVYNIDALSNVYWSDSSSLPVNFIFTPYSCELTPLQDYVVFEYNGYHDTAFRSSGGEGGGLNKEERDMSVPDLNTNPDFAKKAVKPLNILNIEENNYKALRDSININLRKRNYAVVEQKAIQILTQFPDSSASTGMIPKLYISMLNLDTGGVKAGQLKTFLENLITNNTQNTGLIKSAFYHIQKCKVKLGSYQSALDGFQYIMTQNPYSYEGLIASWDYAATYLLMGSGGLSNIDNFNTEEELNTPADTLINRMLKGDINSDRNSERNKTSINQNKQQTGISNEQSRKEFYEKIKTVNKDSKTIQEEKVKTLEKKIETSKDGKTKEDARTELTKMKQINEAVKIKKPENIKTHTIIINNDIRKVFGIGKKPVKETSMSALPKTFELYQNYPNPFNPATKIAFDLPKDARVKLVIYDILGREVKMLVNNEFRTAGKYITEFNGSQLASGIYFARILVNDGKEFIAVKKMVLIK